ncbi:MAG: RluA family pseudouridine synthase [Treponemataceae bacterium]|nr:RluA family pseudouridine synthase [Treponemataceae bacterium]
MDWKKFYLQEDDSQRRADRVLKRLLPHKTQGQIYSALRKGLVKLNSQKIPPSHITQKGDELSVAAFLLEGESHEKTPREIPPRADSRNSAVENPPRKNFIEEIMVFKNEHIVFLNKPCGISVHGKDSLEELFSKSAQKSASSISFRQGPLHRLDKNTSGLIAFSASLSGAKWFSEKMKNHEIKKSYIGIAEGNIAQEQIWREKIEGKDAHTIARPLAHGNFCGVELTLVEYKILTGRKHQIRAHGTAHGHPLFGDEKYGGKEHRGQYFLHAYKMEFPANELSLPDFLKVALPKNFSEFLKTYFKNALDIFAPFL